MKPTLDYWRAKSELCSRLFQEQIQDKEKQSEAFNNLQRMMHAETEIMLLTKNTATREVTK